MGDPGVDTVAWIKEAAERVCGDELLQQQRRRERADVNGNGIRVVNKNCLIRGGPLSRASTRAGLYHPPPPSPPLCSRYLSPSPAPKTPHQRFPPHKET